MSDTIIDGVIEIGTGARYQVLDTTDLNNIWTIEMDATLAERGVILHIGTQEIGLYDEGNGIYLGWFVYSTTDGFAIPIQYNSYKLAFSFDGNNTARMYVNGNLARAYTFKSSPEGGNLFIGPSSEFYRTCHCYIDEFIVYDFAYTGKTADEKDVQADFEASITEGPSPLEVDFTDKSTSKDNKVVYWEWDFGDGGTSLFRDPTYTYASDGMYNVSLTVLESGTNARDTETKQFYINVTDTPTVITAAFESDVVTGSPPLTVQFEDCSYSPNEIISWQWNFDALNHAHIDSVEQNPSYTFTDAGVYTVSLKVIDSNGDYDTLTRQQYISCQADENTSPVANFMYSNVEAKTQGSTKDLEFLPALPITTDVNQSVYFSDMSSNMTTSQIPLTWLWNFGDGETLEYTNVTRVNGPVVHAYTSEGTYNITLTVTNAFGSDSVTQTPCVIVILGDCKPPAPAFTCNPNIATVGQSIQFTDLTYRLPKSWSWIFGDGGTSTLQHPTHSYNTAGFFDVTLKTDNDCGAGKLTKTKYITVNSPVTADFTSEFASASSNDVQFYDASTGSISSRLWTFGDGSTSTLENPLHTYPINDTVVDKSYTVTLTVYGGSTSDAERKSNYITIGHVEYDDDYLEPPPPGQLFLTPREGIAPLTVTAITTYIQKYMEYNSFYRILWGDETVSSYVPWNINGLTHTYAYSGRYVAILEIVTGKLTQRLKNIVSVFDPSDEEDDGIIEVTPTKIEGTPCTYKDGVASVIQLPGDYTTDISMYYFYGQKSVTTINYTIPTCSSAPNAKYMLFSSISSEWNAAKYAMNLIYDKSSNSIIFEHIEEYDFSAPLTPRSTIVKYQFKVPNTGEISIHYTKGNSQYYNLMNTLEVYVGDSIQSGVVLFDDVPTSSTPLILNGGTQFLVICASFSPGTYHMAGTGSGNALMGSYMQGVSPLHDQWFIPSTTTFLYGTAITSLIMKYGKYEIFDNIDFDFGTNGSTTALEPVLPVTFYVTPQINFSEYSLTWEFGDGLTDTTNTISPTHVYHSPGSFDVTLTLTRIDGKETTVRKPDFIKVGEGGPYEFTTVANFTANVLSGQSPLTVQFTNMCYAVSKTNPHVETAITGFTWLFGDDDSSIESNPTHTYYGNGSYTVYLRVVSAVGSDTEIREDYIIVRDPVADKPVSEFRTDAGAVSIEPNTYTYFRDTSTNLPATWSWDFGNGDTATTQDAYVSYATEGTYTVTLETTNSYGSATEIKPDYITVGKTTSLLSTNFYANIGTSTEKYPPYRFAINTPVGFYDISESSSTITQRKWNFGDGTSMLSSATYVTHTYTTCGTYTVSLTLTNADSRIDTETKTQYVQIYKAQEDYLVPINLQYLSTSDTSMTDTVVALNQAVANNASTNTITTNSLYTTSCYGNWNRNVPTQSIISFVDNANNYIVVLDTENIEGNTTNLVSTYFKQCFSLVVDFRLAEPTDLDNGGTLLSIVNSDSSLDDLTCMINVHNVNTAGDTSLRISFDQYSPTFPLTASEFILCPGILYKVVLVYQEFDYANNKTIDDNGTNYFTEFFNSTPELRAYIVVNEQYWYSLGTYTVTSNNGDKLLCLGGPEGTLGSSSLFEYKLVKTYNYPYDKNYIPNNCNGSKPSIEIVPITSIKFTNPTLYDECIARDFDNCVTTEPETTRHYICKGVYTTENTYLANIGTTGCITDNEFGLLINDGTLTFATFDSRCDCPFFTWSYTFTDLELSEYQNYLIMGISNPRDGTTTLKNSMDLDIYDTVSKSFVTYITDDGEEKTMELMVLRYPINTLSGAYILDYKITY
jgi:PKD repeat protein